MSASLKITSRLFETVLADLRRPHAFAHERVGFLTAGVASTAGNICILTREYQTVDDTDYIKAPNVGAMIGSAAMRKALQFAYRSRAALLHVHTHGGYGQTEFSEVDLRSAAAFVPGFFHVVPRMPHGLIVLSNERVTGMLWQSAEDSGAYIRDFFRVGAPCMKYGRK